MQTILLVFQSEEFRNLLQAELQKDHIVLTCGEADTAVQLLSHHPDALITELDLPGIDGLTFLENLPFRPVVILPVGLLITPYIAQKLYDMGVGFSLQKPCTVACIANRVRDMLCTRLLSQREPQRIAAAHLAALGIPTDKGGGRHLRISIPLFAQDQEQHITKELYPAVAKVCGTTGNSVEHTIRNSIQSAWDYRNEALWESYFPKSKKCPSNKVFISTLAEKLWEG